MSATISAERLIEAVRDLLEDRWIEYRRCGEGDDYYLFVRAMVEGLLTGMQLAQ
jgi:hypothetical protein